MKTNAIATSILALTLSLPLVACSSSKQADAGTSGDVTQATKEAREQTSQSVISAEIRKGIQKAKQELATKDIDVNSVHIGHGRHDDDGDSRPKAVITPQGDLLIAGKKVEATPEQHAMLLDYRQQIVGIADAGMDIGASGADLGASAAKQAIWGALTGKSDKEIEAAIKPQTDQIQAAAARLCQRMPDLLASQQKLAAAMPEFRPYATMTQKDVDDCGKHLADMDGKKGVAVFSD
jgi:hypothetical protein